jgi:hypothetical protein
MTGSDGKNGKDDGIIFLPEMDNPDPSFVSPLRIRTRRRSRE